MANSIGSTGLTTATQSELYTAMTDSFKSIYGQEINLDANSPDAQMINIFIQSVLDILSLVTNVNAMFDPNQAVGTILDQRCAINGIQRLGGSYTVTNIQIVTSKGGITLYGLDQTAQPVYTVQDNAGTQWQLQETQIISSASTYSFAFQAAVLGATLTTPNTITTPVTIVLGVSSINNPDTYTTLGVAQETDAQLRLRRSKSVSNSSQGYLAGLLGSLESISGVSSAYVYENDTSVTDSNTVPGHSIWVIMAGSGSDASIADTIYKKRNAGCGMKGSVSYTITQVDGSPFVVYWDIVTPETLFTKFTANSLDGINPPNIAAIISGLTTSSSTGYFFPTVYQQVNINELSTLVQDIDANTMVTGAGFSTTSGGSYTNTLTPTARNYQFNVVAENIIVLPIIMNCALAVCTIVNGVVTGTTASVASGGSTLQFTPLGGYAPYTYSKLSGNGSINSAGLYTSGIAGTAVVQVTDALSNVATCTITVTA